MTTIAAANGVMAADTQLSGNGRALRVCKLFRLPDGGVVSGAGNWAAAYAGIRYLMEGEHGDAPDLEGADLLIYRPDLTLWLANGQFPAFPLLTAAMAMGSGEDLANAALMRGESAENAVRAAFPVDLNSSGPIQTMTVCTVAFPAVQAPPSKKPRKR